MLKSQGNTSLNQSNYTKVSSFGTSKSFDTMLQYFHSFDENGYSSMNGGWINELTGNGTSDQALLMLAYCFDTMKDLHHTSYNALKHMTQRTKNQKNELKQRLQTVSKYFIIQFLIFILLLFYYLFYIGKIKR